MNPRAALNIVHEAIKNKPISPVDKWELAVVDGVITCVPHPLEEAIPDSLGRIDQRKATTGFGGREWDIIMNRIHVLMVKDPLWVPTAAQKPKELEETSEQSPRKKRKRSSKASTKTNAPSQRNEKTSETGQ